MTVESEALIIAFRRDGALTRTLRALAEQTTLPATITVWDNANSVTTKSVVIEEARRFSKGTIQYVGSSENLGPAGALSSHMKDVGSRRGPESWLIRIDDDADLTDPDELQDLHNFAALATDLDPLTAAVGLRGATFNPSRGMLQAASQIEPNGLIEVDTLHGGYLPMFKVGPAADAGGFNADLFFGFEELEFGLRLRTAGFKQYAAPSYIDRNPDSFAPSRPRILAEVPGWRQYYSVRNLISIVREFGTNKALLEIVVIRSIVKPLANVVFRPNAAVKLLRINAMAVNDALRNRTGRLVEPDKPHAETVFGSSGPSPDEQLDPRTGADG